jgi:chemotaxis protein methyltransferase CheR
VLTEPGWEDPALRSPACGCALALLSTSVGMDMEMVDLNPMSQLSHESYLRFAEYITKELGIKMPEAKQMLIQNRLLRRVRELGMQSVEEYSRYFFESPTAQEREQLINAITTNKTDFFREPEHFEFLRKTVLPFFTPQPGWSNQLLVWSAACSSGVSARA